MSLPKTDTKPNMLNLRKSRRKEGYCAQCGKIKSDSYLCNRCAEIKDRNKELREKYQVINGHCPRCQKTMPNNKIKACVFCKVSLRNSKDFSPFGRLPIKYQVTNQVLFKLMEDNLVKVTEVSECLNVNHRTLLRWLCEAGLPSYKNAIKVAELFGVSVESIWPDIIK